jgi:hypothetical protein
MSSSGLACSPHSGHLEPSELMIVSREHSSHAEPLNKADFRIKNPLATWERVYNFIRLLARKRFFYFSMPFRIENLKSHIFTTESTSWKASCKNCVAPTSSHGRVIFPSLLSLCHKVFQYFCVFIRPISLVILIRFWEGKYQRLLRFPNRNR